MVISTQVGGLYLEQQCKPADKCSQNPQIPIKNGTLNASSLLA